MSTRLTYTSGSARARADTAFEAALEEVRSRAGRGAAPARGRRGCEYPTGSAVRTARPVARESVSRAARTRPARRAGGGEPFRRGRGRHSRRGRRLGVRRALRGCCQRAGEAIGERHMRMAAAVTNMEAGKSRTESIAEVQEAIDLIEAYARHMEENEGYTRPLNSFVDGERNLDVLRPYGVFGVIAPFNFPVALVPRAWPLGADRRQHRGLQAVGGAALDGRRLANRPAAGPLRAVQPRARRAGRRARARGRGRRRRRLHRLRRGGREIARKLRGPVARPALTEMGGKNPAIVTASADLDAAAEGVARSAFGLRARSAAPARARSCSPVHDEFVERLAARAEELGRRPGDRDAVRRARDRRGRRRALRARRSRRRGATAASRPAAGGPDLPGHFVEPTVVAGLPHGHELERDELFLPFVTVTRVGSFDEALAEANAPVYGLTAGIFTATRPRRSASSPRSRRASST